MAKWFKYEVHLPAFIYTLDNLRGLPKGKSICILLTGQKDIKARFYALVHSFHAVDEEEMDRENALIGHYTLHRKSPLERPTHYLVDVLYKYTIFIRIRCTLRAFSIGGIFEKISDFFKKSFSMRGVYLIFAGITNIPPWSDFRNLTPMYIWGAHCAFLHFSCQAACYPPHTIHPRTGSHTPLSSMTMTKTKRMTRIVHIVTLVSKTRNKKTANRELDVLRRRACQDRKQRIVIDYSAK
jgi:hypothetical protein